MRIGSDIKHDVWWLARYTPRWMSFSSSPDAQRSQPSPRQRPWSTLCLSVYQFRRPSRPVVRSSLEFRALYIDACRNVAIPAPHRNV